MIDLVVASRNVNPRLIFLLPSLLLQVYYPGWVARFYCDDTVPTAIVEVLRQNGAEVEVLVGRKATMFTRFLAAADPSVDRFIVRDADSRLNPRERFAVEEWIKSGKGVHSMRDHPNHAKPLNGGLWGARHGAIRNITGLIESYLDIKKYGMDMTFLNEVVWPQVAHDQLSHDAYSCRRDWGVTPAVLRGSFLYAKPFPTQRPDNFQHVGQVFEASGVPRQKDIDCCMRNKPSPLECRGKPEWTFG